MTPRAKVVYAVLICLLSISILATGGMVDGVTAEPGPVTVFLPLLARSAETVIPETTKMLPETTTRYLLSVSEDGSLFTFSRMTVALAGVREGDVVIGLPTNVAPYGFLRKVTQIGQQSGKVLLKTEPAALEEAIERGTIRASWQLRPEDIPQSALPPGMSVRAGPEAGDGSGNQPHGARWLHHRRHDGDAGSGAGPRARSRLCLLRGRRQLGRRQGRWRNHHGRDRCSLGEGDGEGKKPVGNRHPAFAR